MNAAEMRAALRDAPDDARIVLMVEGDDYHEIEVKPERQSYTDGVLDGVDYNVVFVTAVART